MRVRPGADRRSIVLRDRTGREAGCECTSNGAFDGGPRRENRTDPVNRLKPNPDSNHEPTPDHVTRALRLCDCTTAAYSSASGSARFPESDYQGIHDLRS